MIQKKKNTYIYNIPSKNEYLTKTTVFYKYLPVRSMFANCSTHIEWRVVLVACARPIPLNLAITFDLP